MGEVRFTDSNKIDPPPSYHWREYDSAIGLVPHFGSPGNIKISITEDIATMEAGVFRLSVKRKREDTITDAVLALRRASKSWPFGTWPHVEGILPPGFHPVAKITKEMQRFHKGYWLQRWDGLMTAWRKKRDIEGERGEIAAIDYGGNLVELDLRIMKKIEKEPLPDPKKMSNADLLRSVDELLAKIRKETEEAMIATSGTRRAAMSEITFNDRSRIEPPKGWRWEESKDELWLLGTDPNEKRTIYLTPYIAEYTTRHSVIKVGRRPYSGDLTILETILLLRSEAAKWPFEDAEGREWPRVENGAPSG